jgi:hypothetical protein
MEDHSTWSSTHMTLILQLTLSYPRNDTLSHSMTQVHAPICVFIFRNGPIRLQVHIIAIVRKEFLEFWQVNVHAAIIWRMS